VARATESFRRLNAAKLVQEQGGKGEGGLGAEGSWGFRGETGLSAGVS